MAGRSVPVPGTRACCYRGGSHVPADSGPTYGKTAIEAAVYRRAGAGNRCRLLTFSRVVSISGQLKVVAGDPDDDKVLECAVVAGATHVVTGDRRHLLPMRSYAGIQIVTPAEFLAAMATP